MLWQRLHPGPFRFVEHRQAAADAPREGRTMNAVGRNRAALPSAGPPGGPRLATFLRQYGQDILDEWALFACSLPHEGEPLDAVAARDHCADIMRAIVLVLEEPQRDAGAGGDPAVASVPALTPSQVHAETRRLQGFSVDAIVAEYRALRASVLAHWRIAGGGARARDTADLARFDEAIEQSIAEAIGLYVRQTKSATDMFIGILGHDIRNPLGTILASAEYLVRSGQLTTGTAAPILNAAARIHGIVEQTVDFSRTQSHGTIPVRRLPGNLGTLLEKVVQETRVRHRDRQLLYDVFGDLLGRWDEQRLSQVLSNLLGNAIAYGSRDAVVTVRAWASSEEHASFSVHNHGMPILGAEQQRIFEPLVRGNAALVERRSRGGLGLGLYICREIARSHGGTITVASSQAAGTTFTVTLPRRPAGRVHPGPLTA
jgi:signal transduction histidine kinase